MLIFGKKEQAKTVKRKLFFDDKRKEKRARLGDKYAEVFLLNRGKKRDDSTQKQTPTMDPRMMSTTPIKRESSFENNLQNQNNRFNPQNQSKFYE
jgi:hypothetical protein